LNSAVAAFKQNDYDTALNIVNNGVKQYPTDAVMHEFRALVLFARGDYQQAAATIHSVLAVGPGWNWTTLSGLYNDVSVYTTQLRALEATVKQRPDDAGARFLLAYHYITDGYADSAARQLQQVAKLIPTDRVASDLLRMVSAPQAGQAGQQMASSQGGPQAAGGTQPTPQSPPNGDTPNLPSPTGNSPNLPSPGAPPTAKPVDPAALVGNWKASRDDGSTFELTMEKDQTFTWKFAQKQQAPQSFDGTYSIEGNVLSLERKGGGAMVAAIDLRDGQHFNFKPVGAPPEDPGLNFGQ